MSRNKLAGIIIACTVVIIVAIVLFTVKPWEPTTSADTYTLTTNISPSGAGSVSPSGGEYESGEQVILNATSASGYTFDYWDYATAGFTSTNPLTITINSNKTITAHFKVVEPSPVIENRPPIIMGMNPDIGWGTVTGPNITNTMIGTYITCQAYDPDGDTMSWSWEANEGTITGAVMQVQWLIPAKPGRYVITVTINDGRGGESSASATADLKSVQVIGDTCHYDCTWTFSI